MIYKIIVGWGDGSLDTRYFLKPWAVVQYNEIWNGMALNVI